MRLTSLAIGLSMALTLSGQAQANDVEDCVLGKSDRTIAACSRIIDAGGSGNDLLALIYAARGQAYASKDQFDQAIEDLDKAIALNPKLIVAYTSRSFVNYSKKDYDAALVEINKAINIEPNNVSLYYMRSWINDSKGDAASSSADRAKIKELEQKSGQ